VGEKAGGLADVCQLHNEAPPLCEADCTTTAFHRGTGMKTMELKIKPLDVILIFL